MPSILLYFIFYFHFFFLICIISIMNIVADAQQPVFISQWNAFECPSNDFHWRKTVVVTHLVFSAHVFSHSSRIGKRLAERGRARTGQPKTNAFTHFASLTISLCSSSKAFVVNLPVAFCIREVIASDFYVKRDNNEWRKAHTHTNAIMQSSYK